MKERQTMQLWPASYENLKCVALSLSLNLRQRLEILANHAQEGQDDEQSLLSYEVRRTELWEWGAPKIVHKK